MHNFWHMIEYSYLFPNRIKLIRQTSACYAIIRNYLQVVTILALVHWIRFIEGCLLKYNLYRVERAGLKYFVHHICSYFQPYLNRTCQRRAMPHVNPDLQPINTRQSSSVYPSYRQFL